MKNKPLIIVSGEPYSVFSEIFYKIFKSSFYQKYNTPIILIGSKNIIEMQMKKMKYSYKINSIKKNEIKNSKLNNFEINLIDVKLNFKKPFGKITNKSSEYIKECFEIAINIMKKKLGFALINGPVSKKHFFHGKYNGITEYLSHKTYKKNDEVMLIYNKLLSVCPITTHIPLKNVSKRISSNEILKKITTINKFYKTHLKKIPKFAVTGLNPHCESSFKNNEENKKIKPAIKRAQKKNLRVKGPFPADTLFTKNNIKKFDVVIGMYHDQVITPLKTLYNFNILNICHKNLYKGFSN